MQKERLTISTCFADREFQDWLASVGIMRRTPQPNAAPSLKKVQRTRPGDILEKFFNLLTSNQGYIIDKDKVAEHIYGRIGPKERQNVTTWSYHLENRLDSAGHLLNVHGVGFAMAVDNFLLNYSSIPIIYRLWLSLGGFVPLGELAIVKHGLNDSRTTVDVLFNVMNPLRLHRLQNTTVGIDYLGSHSVHSIMTGNLRFRLFEKPEGPKKQRKNGLIY